MEFAGECPRRHRHLIVYQADEQTLTRMVPASCIDEPRVDVVLCSRTTCSWQFFLVSAISACSFETRRHREMGTARERALFEARRVLFGRLDSYVAASSDLEILMIAVANASKM